MSRTLLRRVLARLAVAATLAATAPALPLASATAAGGYCSGGGVNVLVDFGALGGGVQRACDPGGDGQSAWHVFEAAGFPLTGVQRFPGAVCRVSAKPSGNSCVQMPPANAYWGLFSSHGSSWAFASTGPGSLTLSDGDTVAFAWQGTSKRQLPRTAPAAPRPAKAKPSAATTPRSAAKRPARGQPTKAPSTAAAVTTASATPTATLSPSASATAKARKHRVAARAVAPVSSPSASAGSAYSSQLQMTAARHDSERGLPWWLPVGAVVVLALAGGGVVLRRRTGAR